MELFIDTTNRDFLLVALRESGRVVAQKKVATKANQSEKLWPAVDALLKDNKIEPTGLKQIVAANGQGSFTALRIGLAAANALGYAWGVPVKDETGKVERTKGLRIIAPRYTAEAKIG